MAGARAACMDAVLFAVKQAHLAAGRFGRELLGRMGLTPARFDLLVAIGHDHDPFPAQSAIRKRLGVARSTLSEMLASVEKLGWIRRSVRSTDRRTWNLALTRRGKVLLRWAYRCWINRGIVPISIDAALASREPEIDSAQKRLEMIGACLTLQSTFGRDPPRDLYMWHPDDYLGAFADPPLPTTLPYVS